MKTQNQIIEQGYKALVDSLGVVDAIRFLQYFNSGKGNYTVERHKWLDKKDSDGVLKNIDKFNIDNLDRYTEVVE